MNFAKLHGLGNDFLVVMAGEAGGEQRSLASLARKMCDRHCSVGADGVVFYQPTRSDLDADYSALIFNSDGSRAEMSGNGLRCVAAFLRHTGQHIASTLRIRTVSGIKRFTFVGQEGLVYRFQCSMGVPITEAAKIPFAVLDFPQPILDFPLQLGSETFPVSLCSMGNPHCSLFLPDISQAPVDRIGPLIESHRLFPKRTNVEFVQVLDRNHLRVRFWERGVGPTLCSGTGSSAAAAVAILKGVAESPVSVESKIGSLDVCWEPEKELFLTGPAEFICDGNCPGADQAD